MVIMNGAAIYHSNKEEFEDKCKIDDETEKFIEETLKELNINAFRYIIDDNMLHCLYTKIQNDAERNYYNHRRKNKFDNFVRASLLDELDISLYVVINKKDKIDVLYNEINNSKYIDCVDLIVYKYESIEGDYYYLKINSNESKKEILDSKGNLICAESYVKSKDVPNKYDIYREFPNGEKYKIDALEQFNKHWDINATDFAKMLENSFAKCANLLASGNYFAYAGISGKRAAFP